MSNLNINYDISTINNTLGTPMQNSGGSVTANIGTQGTLSTSTKQSDGTQKTQIVDPSGNVISSTSNALNVNLSSGGFATSSNQTTEITSLSSINSNQTNGTQLTRITNGTQSADTISGDSSYNSLAVGSGVKSVSYSSISATTTGINVTGYKSFSIQITALSGNWTIQQSNDNVNYVATAGQSTSTGTFSSILPANNIQVFGALSGNYFRLVAGTNFSGTIVFSTQSIQFGNVGAIQIGNWSMSVAGFAASGASVSGNPVRIGGRGINANYTAVTNNQTADLITTLVGALIQKPYSIPEHDWYYAAATGGISNTATAVTIAAAAGAGLRNYITCNDLTATALGVGTEFAIRDGAGGTVLWRTDLTTSGLLSGFPKVFPTPLKGSPNTLLEIVTLTATVTGSVYFNCSGYIAP